MNWAFLIVLWVHLLAATFWVGGMLCFAVVLVPSFRAMAGPEQVMDWLRPIAQRFQVFVWRAMALLVLTGVILLPHHIGASRLLGSWPSPLVVKMVLVAFFIGLTLIHGLVIGPRVGRIKQEPMHEWTKDQHRWVKLSPWVTGLNLLLGMGVLLAGVSLVKS